jgi:glyceraldehyde 3-phosphate dehydrogenase
MKSDYNDLIEKRILDEKSALELIPVIGNLWLDKAIEVSMFRNQLIDKKVSEIIQLHYYAKNIVNKHIDIADTLAVAKALYALSLCPSKIDIGSITAKWSNSKSDYNLVEDFLRKELADFLIDKQPEIAPKDVVLYGFGRIGRIAARELIQQAGPAKQLRLKAIVVRGKTENDLHKRAELLKRDSVHGPFYGTVEVDAESNKIIINGQAIDVIYANKPSEIDYTKYGINNALLIDNTGAWRDREGLSEHLKSNGIEKVLLTAPGKGDIPNIVFGVNQDQLELTNENIFSAASCTTNAIVPVLQVMNAKFNILSGHIETIHSYTNDQNLLDNFHKKQRRGRSAAINMVITETGAGKAVTKVIPSLAGKLTANAVRVPTPNGSLAVIHLQLVEKVTKDQINETIKFAALNGKLVEQINYSFSNELVSSDIIGNSCPSVFDSPSTIVSNDGKSVVLYVWYDNEYGYTRQVIRLAKYIAKVRRPTNY